MPTTRLEASSIKNKVKRLEIARKLKREKGQRKLQPRLVMAKAEIADPATKVCPLSSRGRFNFRKGWREDTRQAKGI